jgi:hypothetical protein
MYISPLAADPFETARVSEPHIHGLAGFELAGNSFEAISEANITARLDVVVTSFNVQRSVKLTKKVCVVFSVRVSALVLERWNNVVAGESVSRRVDGHHAVHVLRLKRLLPLGKQLANLTSRVRVRLAASGGAFASRN